MYVPGERPSANHVHEGLLACIRQQPSVSTCSLPDDDRILNLRGKGSEEARLDLGLGLSTMCLPDGRGAAKGDMFSRQSPGKIIYPFGEEPHELIHLTATNSSYMYRTDK
jgi:hypothetical protein